MTLPRILTIGGDGTMRIEPAEELNSLRRSHMRLEPGRIDSGAETDLCELQGDTMELQVAIEPQGSAQCGVIVRRSPDGEEQTSVVYDALQKVLRIELDRSSLDRSTLPKTFFFDEEIGIKDSDNPALSVQEAPFALEPREALELRIFLDRSVLEVYANERQCLTQRIYPTRDDSLGVGLFSSGGSATVRSLDAWDMTPIVIR